MLLMAEQLGKCSQQKLVGLDLRELFGAYRSQPTFLVAIRSVQAAEWTLGL